MCVKTADRLASDDAKDTCARFPGLGASATVCVHCSQRHRSGRSNGCIERPASNSSVKQLRRVGSGLENRGPTEWLDYCRFASDDVAEAKTTLLLRTIDVLVRDA